MTTVKRTAGVLTPRYCSAMTGDPTVQRAGRRRLPVFVVPVLTVLALVYALWVAYLFMGATEGDVPDASLVPVIPAGAQVLSERVECGSGGCWWEVRLRPADGRTASDLAEQMGVTEQVRIRGNLLDPRTVRVESSVAGNELRISLRYWG